MTALYQIREDLRALLASLELTADGEDAAELPEDFGARLDALEGQFHDKAANVALYAQEMRRQGEMAEAESKRLAAMAKARFNRFDSLKQYLYANMMLLNIPKIESPLAKIRIQKNSRPSIMWNGDMKDLPERYKRVVTSVDGGAAYDDWKKGIELPGFIVDHGSHLRIS